MGVISCVWGPGAEAAAARVRSYCTAKGWELVAETAKLGVDDGTLGWMLRVGDCTGAQRLILTREGLAELEGEFPRIWKGVRARLEDRGMSVVAV